MGAAHAGCGISGGNNGSVKPMANQLSDAEKVVFRDAYHKGMEDGMRRFAWWRDGTQYVGTCGMTLRQAVRQLDAEFGRACGHKNKHNEDGVDYCTRCGTTV